MSVDGRGFAAAVFAAAEGAFEEEFVDEFAAQGERVVVDRGERVGDLCLRVDAVEGEEPVGEVAQDGDAGGAAGGDDGEASGRLEVGDTGVGAFGGVGDGGAGGGRGLAESGRVGAEAVFAGGHESGADKAREGPVGVGVVLAQVREGGAGVACEDDRGEDAEAGWVGEGLDDLVARFHGPTMVAIAQGVKAV